MSTEEVHMNVVLYNTGVILACIPFFLVQGMWIPLDTKKALEDGCFGA